MRFLLDANLPGVKSNPHLGVLRKVGRESSFLDQRFALCHGVGMVDVQYGDGRTPDIGETDESRAAPAKVCIPTIFTRME